METQTQKMRKKIHFLMGKVKKDLHFAPYGDKIVKSSSKVLCGHAVLMVGQAVRQAGYLGGNHIEQN